MAILKSDNGNDLIITCNCGCDEGVRLHIDYDEYGYFAYQCFLKGKFSDERCGVWETFKEKCKRIWAVITNKNYYYSDIVMSKDEWNMFRQWVNSIHTIKEAG